MSNFNIGIYRIRNKVTGRCIYGSSKNIEKRWKGHQKGLENQTHENLYLQRAWNKYGPDSFVFEKVEECEIDKLFIVEQTYIDNNKDGYNMSPAGGGDTISKHPNNKEIRKKISNAVKSRLDSLSAQEKKYLSRPRKNNPNWQGGKSKKECSKCGTTISPRNNYCIKCIDRSGQNNPFYRKKHTEEAKQKNREAHLGKKLSEEAKHAISGENSLKFQGYYYTPWGEFPSSSQAQNAHSYLKSNTINTWCKNPDVKILRLGKSKFLKEKGPECIGKTYRDLGFWFKSKTET